MRRTIDVTLAVGIGLIFAIPAMLIGGLVKITSPGPVLYWSRRIGQGNRPFLMPKFRTMKLETPQLATHLLENPDRFLTPIGGALRKFSLDEIPQVWSVFRGDMTLVGPRPALFNQGDLIEQRTRLGVDKLVPGITGWAQVMGRDNIEIPAKVELDSQYLQEQSLKFDLYIMSLTVIKVLRKDGVSH
jgi:O-antigen biosynthesis protein WbqP